MADITVVGGINIDIEGRPNEALRREDSNPGKISISYGGVGRNIAENAARMGGDIAMISVIGKDHMGLGAKEHLKELGVDVSGIERREDETSAIYLSILNDNNDMELAISDMDAVSYTHLRGQKQDMQREGLHTEAGWLITKRCCQSKDI